MPEQVEYLLVTAVNPELRFRSEARSCSSELILNLRMLSFPNDTCGMGLSLRHSAFYLSVNKERYQ